MPRCSVVDAVDAGPSAPRSTLYDQAISRHLFPSAENESLGASSKDIPRAAGRGALAVVEYGAALARIRQSLPWRMGGNSPRGASVSLTALQCAVQSPGRGNREVVVERPRGNHREWLVNWPIRARQIGLGPPIPSASSSRHITMFNQPREKGSRTILQVIAGASTRCWGLTGLFTIVICAP
jgi:hypothetical protein